MSVDTIRKNEADLLAAAIERILSSDVSESAITNNIPLTDELTDSNKIYYGKASMLFVDMRKSTQLPEKFSTDQLIKIYRSYIRAVVQAIRYSGGVVKDFMGDGVLAVFIDDEEGSSEDKAVRAARYITTAVDKFLNPALDEKIKHRISCGIGIHTGEISLSKVGMKGKEQQDDAESEFGIAWIGNSTNLACKFSSAVDDGTIFISPSTYAALSDVEAKQDWERIEISASGNVLVGFIAKHYYLQLDPEIESCPAGSTGTVLSLAEELRKEYQKQLADIAQKAKELGMKEQALQNREHQLNLFAADVNRKAKENISAEQRIWREKYRFCRNVLGSGFCKKEYVLKMGEAFWERYLGEAIETGVRIGKDEHRVKQDVSYYMVDIYENLELYDKAYEFLIEQATGNSWVHLLTVQNVVRKVRFCTRLRYAVHERLNKGDLDTENRKIFEQIEVWLISFEKNG